MFVTLLFTSLLGLLTFLFALYGLVKLLNFKSKIGLEKLEKWSEKNKIKIDKTKIRSTPFRIEYDEQEWNLLVQKLNLTRYFEPMSDVPKFDYGFDPEYAKELVDYWRTKFDWKSRIEYLNKYPQFKIFINDTPIHYVHYITNENIQNIPRVKLLIMDGWPGSFFGFYEVIDYLEKNFKDTSYDIIVPTIPGYGYSTPFNKLIDAMDTGMLYDAIMRYEHGEDCNYFIHGEDWGSVITTLMAKMYPNRVKAIHITMPPLTSFFDLESLLYTFVGSISPNSILNEDEKRHKFYYNFKELFRLLIRKCGYFHMQATKPDTLGTGLTDSPVGLLAYVLEKYSFGSFGFKSIGKRDGNLEKLNRDELLTIITFYWMTNSITSSMRIYRNVFYLMEGWPRTEINKYKTSEQMPVAVQYFKYEVSTIPYLLLKKKYPNLKRFKIEEDGGHFAGFENPKLTADDFISFIKSL